MITKLPSCHVRMVGFVDFDFDLVGLVYQHYQNFNAFQYWNFLTVHFLVFFSGKGRLQTRQVRIFLYGSCSFAMSFSAVNLTEPPTRLFTRCLNHQL